MRFRFAFAFALALALAFAAVAVAQDAPGLPFSPSSGGGLTASSLTGIFCKLTGGADCQMTGQIRLQAGGTSPQITWHGSDGWGTASNYGVAKASGSIALYANNLWNPVATFGTDSMWLQSNAAQSFLYCLDGGVYDYCSLLSSTTAAAGAYVDINASLRADDGTAALPVFSFASDTNTGIFRSTADTLGFAAGGGAEALLTTSAFTPGTSEGSALGTSATPWQRVMVGAGATADPSVQVGDEDAGMYYDDAANTLYVQSPNPEGTDGSIAIVSDSAGYSQVLGGVGYLIGTGAMTSYIDGGGVGTKLTIVDTDAVEVQAPTVSLGTAATLTDAIRGPNRTASGNAPLLQLPRSVGTAPLTAQTCSSTNAGGLVYVDDTDDALPALLCVCHANAAGTYAWRTIDDLTTACP